MEKILRLLFVLLIAVPLQSAFANKQSNWKVHLSNTLKLYNKVEQPQYPNAIIFDLLQASLSYSLFDQHQLYFLTDFWSITSLHHLKNSSSSLKNFGIAYSFVEKFKVNKAYFTMKETITGQYFLSPGDFFYSKAKYQLCLDHNLTILPQENIHLEHTTKLLYFLPSGDTTLDEYKKFEVYASLRSLYELDLIFLGGALVDYHMVTGKKAREFSINLSPTFVYNPSSAWHIENKVTVPILRYIRGQELIGGKDLRWAPTVIFSQSEKITSSLSLSIPLGSSVAPAKFLDQRSLISLKLHFLLI